MAETANYAVRLSESLKAEAERIAREDGTTLDQFINVAIAEKISALKTAEFFAQRAGSADVARALAIVRRAGKPGQVVEGDEVNG